MKKNIKTALQALILFIVVLGSGIAGYSCGGHGAASKVGKSTHTTSDKVSNQDTHDWGQWKNFMREYNL